MFVLDPAFAASSVALTSLELCDVRLHNDSRFAWLVLIPRIAGVTGLEDLPSSDHGRLMAEVLAAGAAVRAMGVAAGRPVLRLNVATLGNITPQLHIHVVGRRAEDAAWPGPVWGHGEPAPYSGASLDVARAAALASLGA